MASTSRVIVDEPDMPPQSGRIMTITGNDSVYAREMRESSATSSTTGLQYKIFLCQNNPPEIVWSHSQFISVKSEIDE